MTSPPPTATAPQAEVPDSVLLVDLDDTLIPDRAAFRTAAANVLAKHLPLAASDPDATTSDDAVDMLLRLARHRWRASSLRQEPSALGVSSWEALWSDPDNGDPTITPGPTAYAIAAWHDTLTALDADPSDGEHAARDLISAREHLVQPYPGTEPVLEELADRYQLWLVSHGGSALQRRKLHLAGLGEYFTHVFISAELGHLKDDPAFAATVHDRARGQGLSVRAVIGDSLSDLVLAAHGGWDAIHLCASVGCEPDTAVLKHRSTLIEAADVLRSRRGEGREKWN